MGVVHLQNWVIL